METQTLVEPRVIEVVTPLALCPVTEPDNSSLARFKYTDEQTVIAIHVESFPQSLSQRTLIKFVKGPHFHHNPFIQRLSSLRRCEAMEECTP